MNWMNPSCPAATGSTVGTARARRRGPRRLATLTALILGLALLSGISASGAMADPPTVTITTVAGTFYPNPNDSGAFDTSQLSNPAFTQSFPVIDFNPPSSAQVACSNATGVNEFSRPFTDVIPNPDGTCSTQVAQGNGQQAGTGSLYQFEAVFQANLNISAPGQVTFNFFSDDGWTLGLGPQSGGANQPTYVSGQLSNAPAASAVQSYPVVGALNGPSSPNQAQVTVNFPAAGTYPVEVDYTECCGGQLALTLGTTAGNPITSAGCPTVAPSPSLADQFGAAVCGFVADEQTIGSAAQNILAAVGTMPPAFQLSPTNVWQVPAVGALQAKDEKTIETNTDALAEAIKAGTSVLQDQVTDKVAERIMGGEIPCVANAWKDLIDASNNDIDAADQFEKATQTLHDLADGSLNATAIFAVTAYEDLAVTSITEKLKSLADALSKYANSCLQAPDGASQTVAADLGAAGQELPAIQAEIQQGSSDIGLLAQGGSFILSPTTTGGPLPIIVDPNLFPLPTTQLPPALPLGATLNAQPLPPLTLSSSTIGAGSGITLSGSGLAPLSSGQAVFGSDPTRLATFTTDASGSFSVQVQIPAQAPGGLHELYAVGSAPDGSTTALGSSLTVTAGHGPAPAVSCPGTLSGTINGGLTVAPGMVCTLRDATVNGLVRVSPGAIFEADASTLHGGVQADSPLAFELCGDQVDGSVTVQSPTLPPLIGGADSPNCAATTVTGASSIAMPASS